jgi:hypothetical protein
MLTMSADTEVVTAPLRILKGGVPVTNTTFVYRIERGYLEPEGSSGEFPDTHDGRATTDSTGVLQIALPVRSAVTISNPVPFNRLLTVAPLGAPDQRFFNQKLYRFRAPGAMPQPVDLQPVMALAKPTQMGMMGSSLISFLVVGTVIGLGIWAFGAWKKRRVVKTKTKTAPAPVVAVAARSKKSRRSRPNHKRRETRRIRRATRRASRRSRRSKEVRATLILRG